MTINESILITGGTGSLGQQLTQDLLNVYFPQRLAIYSRGEFMQYEMAKKFPDTGKSPMRYFIGDVRDKERLKIAMEGVHLVIHAAALKQVPACEYNPFEAIKTNIHGTQNVIDAAIESETVGKVMFISTDKAVEPVNLYGMTKAVAEKLIINANLRTSHTKFSAVRYGNVMGSRGSVIPYFKHRIAKGEHLPVTSTDMTRFWITLPGASSFVLQAIEDMQGGEIFIPKLPSFGILDLIEALEPGYHFEEVGIRPGEKIDEKLISRNECNVSNQTERYVITPGIEVNTFDDLGDGYIPGCSGIRAQDYSSGQNKHFLTAEDLRKLIEENP